MKRTQIRRKPRRKCVVCRTDFLSPYMGSKTCSRECAQALKKVNRRRSRKSQPASWTAMRDSFCAVCHRPTGVGLWGGHVHHVVYRQHVRRYGGSEWDPRNAVTLCEGCHAAHHNRSRPVPLSALPNDAISFAFELMGVAAHHYLTRRYAGTDERVEAADAATA